MICHENLESYYSNNFSMLFQANGNPKIQYTNNFSLDDVENMLPYEREIYMALMQNKIKEVQEQSNKK